MRSSVTVPFLFYSEAYLYGGGSVISVYGSVCKCGAGFLVAIQLSGSVYIQRYRVMDTRIMTGVEVTSDVLNMMQYHVQGPACAFHK